MSISHLYFDKDSNEWHIQTNFDHQNGVAKLAAAFGTDIGCDEFCHVLGLLHDLGKEQIAFQNHIKKQSGYDLTIKNDEHPKHAYVGALAAHQLFPAFDGYLMGEIIAAHHSGLKDYTDFESILTKPIPKGILIPNISKPIINSSINNSSDIHHLIRMMYSCLVDADFLDTETFMNGGKSRKDILGKQNSIPELLEMLESHLKGFESQPKSDLNIIRAQIQNQCRKHASCIQGIYSLTVPTGGGKTLSGLLWALKHAVKHGLKRIIIAIPYTSIIVQTADTLRSIFGENNVLEHHSAFDVENVNSEDVKLSVLRQRLASENWDYPIIVTTNVQLFQSMMASKPSRCRKLHNITNSVIILDEAQMLPTEHLQPIIDMLKTYNRVFKCSILLSTASQPVLIQKYIQDATKKLCGLDEVTEIIPQTMNLHNRLRRVELHFNEEELSYDDVAKKIMQHRQVLCIVNTRRDAMEIFSRLPKESGRHYHLSRMMCSEHLASTIKEIRAALKDSSDEPIRVVATQLIEAGVDVDFETVLRQEAGLDSILQAAGRCNREGHNPIGNTFVFKLNTKLPRGYITNANNARLAMISDKERDWFAPNTMNEYFRQLYSRCDNFDKADIKSKTSKPTEIQFETAALDFKLIEDNGINVIVNYKDSHLLIEQIKLGNNSYQIQKKLSRYSVSLHQRDFKNLFDTGMIDEVSDNIYFIPDMAQYDVCIGLSVNSHWLNEIQII